MRLPSPLPLAFVAATIAVVGATAADSLAPAWRHVRYSRNERYSITMIPGTGTRPGEGIAQEAGSGEILWRVDWWASPSQVELADDGRHLVRLGQPSLSPGLFDTAIAFYAGGKELKRYAVRDLLKDRSKVGRSVSFYHWIGSSAGDGWAKDGRAFTLTLIDGGRYTFHTATGRIASYRRSLR